MGWKRVSIQVLLVILLLIQSTKTFAQESQTEKLRSALESLFTPKELNLYAEEVSPGIFKRIYIEAKEAKSAGLPLNRVEIEAIDIELNPPEEWKNGKIKVLRAKNVRLSITIVEDDLNSFLREKLKEENQDGIKNAYVKIKKDKLMLAASYQVNGLPLRFLIELSGKLKMDGSKIILTDYDLHISGFRASDETTSKLLGRVNPLFDLKVLPFPVENALIEQSDKYITIKTAELPEKTNFSSLGGNNPNTTHVGN